MQTLAAIARSILTAIAAIIASIARLFGYNPAPVVPPAQPSGPTPDDILGRLDRGAGEAPAPNAPGAVIYTYATSDQADRAVLDLAGLTVDQQRWLLSLSDSDLRKLAQAGRVACDRAAAGKRSGVVGLPLVGDVPAQPQAAARKPDRYERLADSIRRHAEVTA